MIVIMTGESTYLARTTITDKDQLEGRDLCSRGHDLRIAGGCAKNVNKVWRLVRRLAGAEP